MLKDQIKYFKDRLRNSTDREELEIVLEFMENNIQKFSMKEFGIVTNKLNNPFIF